MLKAKKLLVVVLLALQSIVPSAQLKAKPLTKRPSPIHVSVAPNPNPREKRINNLVKKAERDFQWAFADDFINNDEMQLLKKDIRLIITELELQPSSNERNNKIVELENLLKKVIKLFNHSQAELQAKKELKPSENWWKFGKGIYRSSDENIFYIVVGPFNSSDDETAAMEVGITLAGKKLGMCGYNNFRRLKKHSSEDSKKYWLLGRVLMR